MEPFLTIIIGAALGILGFFTAKFWIQPILIYRETKSKIIGRLIYFSDVYEDETSDYLKNKSEENSEIKEIVELNKSRMQEKQLEYRKLSGELMGVIIYLPSWYRLFLLKIRGENPLKVRDELIGLSNSREYKDDQNRKYNIQVLLKVPGWKKLKSPNKPF